jgi:hypothetical protein
MKIQHSTVKVFGRPFVVCKIVLSRNVNVLFQFSRQAISSFGAIRSFEIKETETAHVLGSASHKKVVMMFFPIRPWMSFFGGCFFVVCHHYGNIRCTRPNLCHKKITPLVWILCRMGPSVSKQRPAVKD